MAWRSRPGTASRRRRSANRAWGRNRRRQCRPVAAHRPTNRPPPRVRQAWLSRTGHDVGRKPVHYDRPGRVGLAQRFEFSVDKRTGQPPRVFEAERVERLVLELPGHHGGTAPIAFRHPSGEFGRAGEKFWVRRRCDQGPLRDRAAGLVFRHVVLRVAERLYRSGANDDGLTGLFGRSTANPARSGRNTLALFPYRPSTPPNVRVRRGKPVAGPGLGEARGEILVLGGAGS